MKLLEFGVKGYKNFTREVRLEGLGRVNVLHGDNNVGKSNLLEAMRLFFMLLRWDAPGGVRLGPERDVRIPEEVLMSCAGARIGDIFDLRGPPGATISLEAILSVPDDELDRAGIKRLLPTDRLVIGLHLEREYGRKELRFYVSRFEFGDGTDAVAGKADESLRNCVGNLARFLTQTQGVHQPGAPTFALIDELRRVRGEAPETPSETPSILSSRMLLNLWDAASSTDPMLAVRFRLLRDLVRRHLPPFGAGELILNFDRHRGEAFLVHELGEARTRHHLLGTGVQQVLNLLGLLLTTHARLVAIEEPECNLRYTLQLRLREAFDTLTLDERGPQQIFLTSHSPAFETEAFFYAMRLDEQGVPFVERRRAQGARDFLGVDAVPPPSGGRGEVAWVSSDGLVLVPEPLRVRLDVTTGGEVAFLTNQQSGRVEVLSEREFLDLLGPEDEGTK